jgi:hypothetical protein
MPKSRKVSKQSQSYLKKARKSSKKLKRIEINGDNQRKLIFL